MFFLLKFTGELQRFSLFSDWLEPLEVLIWREMDITNQGQSSVDNLF